MNVQKSEESKCRICWSENGELDWNNLIYSQSDLTYRACFYKYTQLDFIDEDSFRNLICYNCSKGLEYIEAFISRAIEANSKLKEMFAKEEYVDPITDIEIKEEEQTSIFYETVECSDITENLLGQAKLHNGNKYKESVDGINDEVFEPNNFLSEEHTFLMCETEEETPKKILIEEHVDTTKINLLVRQLRKYSLELSSTSSKRCNKRKKHIIDRKLCEKLGESHNSNSEKLKSNESSKTKNPLKVSSNRMPEKVLVAKTKANKTGERMFLCQYCSAEIKGWHKLHVHEANHTGVRKRTETCAQCGVKFYTKSSLRLHEKTHDANREKKCKCEFCEKAFYNMGALNVHRRIHLGLMVKCQICSKEFFRNIELYKHMNSHSSTLINVAVKKRSRYFVRCKHCSKKILSTSFKSHTAAHLNQPLVKCSICNKEYFNRESCRHHIRTIHKKNPETVNEYIFLLKTDRLTHLYIRQNADIELDEK